MEPIGWAVVTNGTTYRLRDIATGEFWEEFNNNPFAPARVPREWDSLEEATAVARKNTWRPVDGTA